MPGRRLRYVHEVREFEGIYSVEGGLLFDVHARFLLGP